MTTFIFLKGTPEEIEANRERLARVLEDGLERMEKRDEEARQAAYAAAISAAALPDTDQTTGGK